MTEDDSLQKSRPYRIKNTSAKKKYDILERVFQSFVDVTYFLEYIEDHPELHEEFEDFLKDLFGVSIDDGSPQSGHYKNRPTSLLYRFLRASLFSNLAHRHIIDFRVQLIELIINEGISAMEMRFDLGNELQLVRNNVANAKLWAELLAKRYSDKPKVAHRRIGYSLPFTYADRARDFQNKKEDADRLIENSKRLFELKSMDKKKIAYSEDVKQIIGDVEILQQKILELGYSFPTKNLVELGNKIEILKKTINNIRLITGSN